MLAVLSDIHSNAPALEAVLADAMKQGCSRFLSLGDVVGYGAQPAECIDLLRSAGAINILGNHDAYIVKNTNCPRSAVVSRILDFQRPLLSAEHRQWLASSSDSLLEGGMLFLHGGPDDRTDQYLYTVSREIISKDVRWLFAGHTHVQAIADFGDRGFCNPGSVGQPRDGDCRAAYAIIDQHTITLHRIDYDIDRAVIAMKAAGFETFCYENLYRGTQIGGRIDSIRINNFSEQKQ